MRKTDVLFILAALLFLLGVVEALSGFLLWFVIPSGGGKRGVEQTFWELSRTTWIDIHDWAAVALLLVILVHIVFHWRWITHMFKTCCPFIRRSS